MKKRYVLGFMVTPNLQHVVLIEKDTDKAEQQWQNGLLNGIGGGIEPGENGLDAMVREFREETGVDTNRPGMRDHWRYCGCVRDANSLIYQVDCYIIVQPKMVLDLVCKQPNEREVPAVYYLPLVKNKWYPLANDVMEILTQCIWVLDHSIAGKFRQFQMLTD